MQARLPGFVLATLLLAAVAQATEPTNDVLRWWRHTRALSVDSMRGRDTGSPEHRRAAEYVARELAKNGVMPAGDNGT